MVQSGFQKTKIGVYPIDWNLSRIGNHCNVLGGGTPNSKIYEYYHPLEIPWLKSGDVNIKKIESATNYISKLGLKNSSAKLLPRNSIILGLSGRGKTRGMVSLLEIESSCNQNLACIVPNEKLYYKFLFYFLEHKYEYIRNFTGDKSRNILNLSLVKSIPIIIPAIMEQKKIACILENVDKITQTTRKIIRNLKESKKGLMQRMFTEGIGHTEFKETKVGKIPKEWEIVNFNNSIIKAKYKIGSLKTTEYQPMGNFPIIDQGQEFISGYSDRAELLYNGDLPVVIFGDHTRILKFIDFKFICGADGTKVLIPNKTLFDPHYLYYAFSNFRIKNLGYSRHYKLLKEFKIPKPPLEEQKRISSLLGNVDNQILNEIKIRGEFKLIKKGLMQDLLTGKIRVKIN